MTIASSGPMRIGTTLVTEYNPAWSSNKSPLRFSSFRRGNSSLLVRANSANNGAANASAGVPTSGPLRIANFHGQGIGWTYTNSTVRQNNYYPHGEFGDDWVGSNGTNWPCYYINNNGIYSTSTSYYACIIYSRQNNGSFTFTNNSEIQGAGGAPNAGAGQHAMYVYNSENASYNNRPIIVNNGAIRGGGGAGGQGGTGGTGGQGYYNYTARDPGSGGYYNGSYQISFTDGGPHGICSIYWGGLIYQQYIPPSPPITIGSYTYYTDALEAISGDQYWYAVYRTWTAQQVTNGGGGGAGGNGGRGIGYNSPNQGGSGGAAGAGGDTNAGSGGYGGTGGTGGGWGAAGAQGGTGATGNGGNYGGGAGGAAGQGGGAAGYSIYAATKWGYTGGGTLNGPTGGGVGNS